MPCSAEPPDAHASRPLLGLALWLAAGCAVGPGLGPGAAGVLLALVAVVLALVWRAAGGRGSRIGLAAAAFGLGAAAAAVEASSWERNALGRWAATADAPARLTGRLAADARRTADHHELILDVESVRAGRAQLPLAGRGRVRVYGAPPTGRLRQGDRVAVWARAAPPRGLRSPGAFDAVAHARRRGIHVHAVAKSGLLVESLGAEAGLVARLRERSRRALEHRVPPGVERGLVLAMVLGDRSGVDDRTAEAFRIAGTYHVLALSGAQVALLTGLLLAVAGRLRLPPLVEGIAVAAAIGGYAAFVGGDVPVVRAAVMAGVLLLGRALDLDADLLNLLGLAALALLVAHPARVGDVGFQLSFGATAAILVLASPLAAAVRRLPLRLDLALAVSFAVQAALAPVLLHHFQRLAPAALLLNLVAAPLASAVLLSGFAVLAVAPVSDAVARLAGEAAWCFAHALLESGRVLEGAALLDLRLPSPPIAVAAAWLAGLFALLHPERRVRGAILMLAAALATALGRPPAPADGRLHVTVLDVGQGDAIVLRSPSGRTALVDAGSGARFDAGAAVVEPFLRRQGVRDLDFVVLTHDHDDHVGGAAAVLSRFPPAALWRGPGTGPAVAPHVPRRVAVRGWRRSWDGVSVEVLGPGRPPPRDVNDASVVVAVGLGRVRFLLAADVETAGEARLSGVAAEALKVAHHGSGTSTTPAFLRRVRPGVAVISCGARNPFGHPHASVLERLRRQGVRVFRTDREGSVRLSTDGERVWVRTEAGSRAAWRPIRRPDEAACEAGALC